METYKEIGSLLERNDIFMTDEMDARSVEGIFLKNLHNIGSNEGDSKCVKLLMV